MPNVNLRYFPQIHRLEKTEDVVRTCYKAGCDGMNQLNNDNHSGSPVASPENVTELFAASN